MTPGPINRSIDEGFTSPWKEALYFENVNTTLPLLYLMSQKPKRFNRCPVLPPGARYFKEPEYKSFACKN